MVTILAFLFVFSIVVVVHELGHFYAGRLFGIRIDRFSLGFGPTLATMKDRQGTEWAISAIPLGGYVKFFGDASAASNPDTDRLAQLRADIEREHGAEAVASCYHFKPVWQRAIVAAAGPFANFVLAVAIFSTVVLATGDSGYAPVIGSVQPDSPAAAAGFEKGDRVLAIGGRDIRYYRDLQQYAALSAGDTTTITVERGGEPVDLEVTVGRRVGVDAFGGESEIGFIGVALGLPSLLAAPEPGSPAEAAGLEAGDRVIAIDGAPVDYLVEVCDRAAQAGDGSVTLTLLRNGGRIERTVEQGGVEGAAPICLGLRGDASQELITERFGPVGALARGAAWTYEAGAAPVRYIGRVLTGKESGRELGGILRIGKVAGSLAEQAYDAGEDRGPIARFFGAVVALVTLAGALSVSIGLLNLLPIPILDGGHLVYYAYEAAAGRPLAEGAQEWGFRIGLALVLGLMIFAAWNDLRYLRVFEAIGNALS
jgi:regulator of sigma E protease